MPVSIDQNARSVMAANAQHLYRPLPNKRDEGSETAEADKLISFFNGIADVDVGVDTGSASSSFISQKNTKMYKENREKNGSTE